MVEKHQYQNSNDDKNQQYVALTW